MAQQFHLLLFLAPPLPVCFSFSSCVLKQSDVLVKVNSGSFQFSVCSSSSDFKMSKSHGDEEIYMWSDGLYHFKPECMDGASEDKEAEATENAGAMEEMVEEMAEKTKEDKHEVEEVVEKVQSAKKRVRYPRECRKCGLKNPYWGHPCINETKMLFEGEEVEVKAELEKSGYRVASMGDFGCKRCGLNFPYRSSYKSHLCYCKKNETIDQGSNSKPLRGILKRVKRKLDLTCPSMGNFRLNPMYLRGILSKKEMDAYSKRHLEVMNEGGVLEAL
jgi:hypothetical protein